MAFAGHLRSLDFSYTPQGPALVGNVHPDRHHHIPPDHLSSRDNIHGSSKTNNIFRSQQDDSQDAYNRNYTDDASSDRLSFRDAVAAGTDDKGHAPTTSLWIGNAPLDLTDDMLVRAFESFGPIVSVRATPTRRCGFVNFQHLDSARSVWYECHERDVFDIGVATWVRYQEPPSFLRDKYSSLKRKRSSTKGVINISNDGLKRPIPIGPRSQTLDCLPPNGPKSQQTSISPPPPRRHDTYRPIDHPEVERVGRSLAERSRQSDSYRPTYEESTEESQTDRRSSLQDREGPPTRVRTQSQATTLGAYQSPAFRAKNSPSPPPGLPQQSRHEDKNSSPGIGIKGLAASRKESVDAARDLHNSLLSGFSIRGAATQTVLNHDEALDVATPQNLRKLRESHVAVQTSTSVKPGFTNLVSINQASANDRSLVADPNRLLALTRSAQLHTKMSASVSTVARNTNVVVSTRELTENKTDGHVKSSSAGAPRKNPLEFLDYVYATKDKEHLLAPKARTISPFGRRRPISRAKSVESAATDPTPITRPLASTKNACDRCEQIDSPYLRLQKCAAPSCIKMIHSKCGKSVSSAERTRLEQKFCDQCFEKQNILADASMSTKSTKSTKSTLMSTIRVAQTGTSARSDTLDVEVLNACELYESKVPVYSFVNTGLPIDKAGDDDVMILHPPAADQMVADNDAIDRHKMVSRTSVSHTDETMVRARAPAASNRHETMRRTKPQVVDVPTEPSSKRDECLDRQAYAIAERYKSTVTCPWWKRGRTCVRREEECIFAHQMTGVESPNGRSVAKDWTCHDWYTRKDCHLTERDCLYSHADTGLYVGVDGKASKKHLECYWWREGRCKYSDADCACAHYATGLVAEEPMQKDAVRRMPTQTSIAPAFKDAELPQRSQRSRPRSPSYSPSLLPVGKGPYEFSIPERASPTPLQEVPESMMNRPDSTIQTPGIKAGIDPRLRRNVSSGNKIDQPLSSTATDRASHDFPGPSRKGIVLSESDALDALSFPTPQQSKQPSTNSCKMCSKKIFKATLCTDCLKLSHDRDREHSSTTRPIIVESSLNVVNDDIASETHPEPVTFTVPAPKILKRSRTTSSSNLFASKRMRPDMTALRTATYPSPGTVSFDNPHAPRTLEQQKRTDAEKKAKEAARAFAEFEPDSSTIEVAVTNQDKLSMPNTPSFARSPTSVTCSPCNPPTFQQTTASTRNDFALPYKKPVEGGQTRATEDSQEAEGESDAVRSEPESSASDIGSDAGSDSDVPLASSRSRSENVLWSSSTSNQSPQEPRTKTAAAAPILSHNAYAPKSSLPSSGSAAVRCAKCVRNHRKCVHTANGEDYDERKCYNWREDRRRLNINHKAHYSEVERDLIMKKAAAYEANLNGDQEMIDADDEDDMMAEFEKPIEQDEDNEFSSSSDEIQISRSRDEAPRSASKRVSSKMWRYGSPRMLSRSPTSDRRQTMPARSRSAFTIPEGMMLVPKKPPKENLSAVIVRLKAKGVVFEDSDTSDDEDDDEFELPKTSDPRIDPLLYHKLGDNPPELPFALPVITKGEGLKHSINIRRRQWVRNFHLFGDAHKQVDRQTPRQEVLAMMERRNPNNILEPPDQVEEMVTMTEFLGLRNGKVMEVCIRKVPRARATFTEALAFKEKDMDPGLGAWGRERRRTKKEKPIFVIGL